MSKQNAFGQAASGEIPTTAIVENVSVMGKPMDIDSVSEVTSNFGQAVKDLVARPVNWLTASTIATPSGGLEAKGHENTKYDYQGGGMYGFEDKGAAPAAKA